MLARAIPPKACLNNEFRTVPECSAIGRNATSCHDKWNLGISHSHATISSGTARSSVAYALSMTDASSLAQAVATTSISSS